MSRAPYSTKKPKKPDYEEPPIVTTHPVPPVEIPTEAPIESTPIMGGLAREDKEVPDVHLGDVHDAAHYFATKHPPKPELPEIQGRTIEDTPIPPQKVVPEPSVRHMENGRIVSVDRWRGIPLTGNIETNVEVGGPATGHKVVPKEGKDAEHS